MYSQSMQGAISPAYQYVTRVRCWRLFTCGITTNWNRWICSSLLPSNTFHAQRPEAIRTVQGSTLRLASLCHEESGRDHEECGQYAL